MGPVCAIMLTSYIVSALGAEPSPSPSPARVDVRAFERVLVWNETTQCVSVVADVGAWLADVGGSLAIEAVRQGKGAESLRLTVAAMQTNTSKASMCNATAAVDGNDRSTNKTTNATSSPRVARQVPLRDGVAVAPGRVALRASAPGVLATISLAVGAGDAAMEEPVARSYDGHSWEALYPVPLSFECVRGSNNATPAVGEAEGTGLARHNASLCLVDLPPRSGAEYRMTMYAVPPEQANRTAARFLALATWGPTWAEVAGLAADMVSARGGVAQSLARWIDRQVSMPASLHRAYFRRRVNGRKIYGSHDGAPADNPCDSGSRWHSHAFSGYDVGRTIVAKPLRASNSSAMYALSIDGVLRTELHVAAPNSASNPFRASAGLAPLTICALQTGGQRNTYTGRDSFGLSVERVGDTITLGKDCAGSFANPAINFSAVGGAPRGISQVLGPLDARLLPVEGVPDARIIAAFKTSCMLPRTLQPSGSYYVASDPMGAAFVQHDGVWYKHDPRVRFVENTLAHPVAEADAAGLPTCPTAPRSFVNAPTCKRQRACSSLAFGQRRVLLNSSVLRLFYTTDSKYVYAVDGLRLEYPYATPPCGAGAGASRWRRLALGQPCSEADVDAATATNLRTHLLRAVSAVAEGAPVVDVRVGTGACVPANTTGARLNVSGSCWQHVHPQTLEVYDFTAWARSHPGNRYAFAAGRPNPITAIAQAHASRPTTLLYPAHHDMPRWKSSSAAFPRLGALGASVDFASLPTGLQSGAMARLLGSAVDSATEDSCGSTGEVSSEPTLGHHYSPSGGGGGIAGGSNVGARLYTDREEFTRVMPHNNLALKAPDQLRQRVAWVLSQHFMLGWAYRPGKEHLLSYYDIFVRGAFGSFENIMKEVTYHPLMGSYLTYANNKAFSVRGTDPDENYARESMQLFSVGLWQLHANGTRKLDAEGEALPTYDNANIMTFARVWTGLRPSSVSRGNVESGKAGQIDPMVLDPSLRDRLPKIDLVGGYLGDGLPLCSSMPARMFLRQGARFVHLGDRLGVPTHQLRTGRSALAVSNESTLWLDANSSLARALCAAPGVGGGRCTLPAELQLAAALPCSSKECDVDELGVVAFEFGGEVFGGGGRTQFAFYEHVRAPCVALPFYEGAKVARAYWGRDALQCADPRETASQSACCQRLPGKARQASWAPKIDERFLGERVSFATNIARCQAAGLQACAAWTSRHATGARYWVNRACGFKAQVDADGQVNVVQQVSAYYVTESIRPEFRPDSGLRFHVRWDGGPRSFPRAADNCSFPVCRRHGTSSSCLCDARVETSAVFRDLVGERLPSRAQVLAELRTGSAAPHLFDEGTYTRCRSAACNASAGEVQVFFDTRTPKSAASAVVGVVMGEGRGARLRYFVNARSTVVLGGSDTLRFRNPPQYHMPWTTPTTTLRDTELETDALLHHLATHPSTAPHFATRLIQRLGCSNPSPRYIEVVAAAFRRGVHGNTTFSGEYGDLRAAVTAVLLDREGPAASATLQADPTHGQLREPLHKVLHFLRSMEFTPRGGAELSLRILGDPRLGGPDIGQQVLNAPSVFGFFPADHAPPGRLSAARLLSPEAKLNSQLLTFMNGLQALAANGLSNCGGGWGRSGGPVQHYYDLGSFSSPLPTLQ